MMAATPTMKTWLVDIFHPTNLFSPCGTASYGTEKYARKRVEQAQEAGFFATIYHDGYILDTRPKAETRNAD